MPAGLADVKPYLEAAIRRCHESGAFGLSHAKTSCPPELTSHVKEQTTFRYESPLRGLAMEMLGLDVFKSRVRHLVKKPYAPLQPYIEAHFLHLTQGFNAVLGEDDELASLWYRNALALPCCGLSDEELTGTFHLYDVLPVMPWHQGVFSSTKGLRNSFESKIQRTDTVCISALRGLPQSPWNQDDVIANYLMGLCYPALWAGMRAWQFNTAMLAAALKDTAGQMRNEFSSEWLGIYSEHLDMIAHVLVKAHAPLFLLPGVALHLLEKGELPLRLDGPIILKGLMLSMARGAFASTSRADDGTPLKFSCPFNSPGIRLLMTSTAEEKKKEGHALPAFVLAMQERPDCQGYVSETQRQMKRLLRRCHQDLLKRYFRNLERNSPHIAEKLREKTALA